MRRSIPFLLITLDLLFIAPFLAADDDYTLSFGGGVFGGMIAPVKNDNIQMEKAVVDIEAEWSQHKIDAIFWLKNASNEPQRVSIAAPFDWHAEIPSYDLDKTEYIKSRLPRRIEVLVQGQRVSVDFSEAQILPVIDNTETPIFYRIWAYWNVSFGPFEAIHIRTRFRLVSQTQPLERFSERFSSSSSFLAS